MNCFAEWLCNLDKINSCRLHFLATTVIYVWQWNVTKSTLSHYYSCNSLEIEQLFILGDPNPFSHNNKNLKIIGRAFNFSISFIFYELAKSKGDKDISYFDCLNILYYVIYFCYFVSEIVQISNMSYIFRAIHQLYCRIVFFSCKGSLVFI
jgi:hypothetical protein